MSLPEDYSRIASHITHAAAGLYAWELAIALPADLGVVLAILCGRRWRKERKRMEEKGGEDKGIGSGRRSWRLREGWWRRVYARPRSRETAAQDQPAARGQEPTSSSSNMNPNITSSRTSTPTSNPQSSYNLNTLIRLVHVLLRLTTLLALVSYLTLFNLDLPILNETMDLDVGSLCLGVWERRAVKALSVCTSVTVTVSLTLSSMFILLRALSLSSLLPPTACSNVLFTLPLGVIYAAMFVGVGVIGAVSGLSYAHLNGFGDAADCAGRNLDTIFPTGAWGGARVIVGFLAYTLTFDVMLTILSMVQIRQMTLRKERRLKRDKEILAAVAEEAERMREPPWEGDPTRGRSRRRRYESDSDSELEEYYSVAENYSVLEKQVEGDNETIRSSSRVRSRCFSHSRQRHPPHGYVADCYTPSQAIPPLPSLPRGNVSIGDSVRSEDGGKPIDEAHIPTPTAPFVTFERDRHASITSSTEASSSTAASVGVGYARVGKGNYREPEPHSPQTDPERSENAGRKEGVAVGEEKDRVDGGSIYSVSSSGYDKFVNEGDTGHANDRRTAGEEYVEMTRVSAANEPNNGADRNSGLYSRPHMPSNIVHVRSVKGEVYPFPRTQMIHGVYSHFGTGRHYDLEKCNNDGMLPLSSEVSLPSLPESSPRRNVRTSTQRSRCRFRNRSNTPPPYVYPPPRSRIYRDFEHDRSASSASIPIFTRSRMSYPPRHRLVIKPPMERTPTNPKILLAARESPCMRALHAQRIVCFGWIVLGKLAMVVCASLVGSTFSAGSPGVTSAVLGRGSFLDPSIICVCVPALILITISSGRLFLGITLSTGSQFGDGFLVRDPPYPPVLTLSSVPFPSPSTFPNRRRGGRWQWTEEDFEDAVVLGPVHQTTTALTTTVSRGEGGGDESELREGSTVALVTRQNDEGRPSASGAVSDGREFDDRHRRGFQLPLPMSPVLTRRHHQSGIQETHSGPSGPSSPAKFVSTTTVSTSQPLVTRRRRLGSLPLPLPLLSEPPLPRPPPLPSWRALRHEDDPERVVIPPYVDRERYVRRVWGERFGHVYECDCGCEDIRPRRPSEVSGGSVYARSEASGSGLLDRSRLGVPPRARRPVMRYGGGGRVGGWTVGGVRAREARDRAYARARARTQSLRMTAHTGFFGASEPPVVEAHEMQEIRETRANSQGL